MGPLKNLLNDATLRPQLDSIGIELEYDELWLSWERVNADSYRFVNNAATEPAIASPPAPLVGIELNPGPTIALSSSSSAISSSPLTVQNFFGDGLHSISGFLYHLEWLTQLRTGIEFSLNWIQFFSSLSHLIHVSLSRSNDSTLIEYLSSPEARKAVGTLNLRLFLKQSETAPSYDDVDDIRDVLNDSTLFPRLEKVSIELERAVCFEWKCGDSGYRQKNVIVKPPESPLVGIELNPGPSSCLSSSLSASTFFTDGLHSIFSFLSIHSLVAVASACRIWKSASISCPSLKASLTLSRHLVLRLDDCDFASPLLHRHVRSLHQPLFVNEDHAISVGTFYMLLMRLPQLTSLTGRLHICWGNEFQRAKLWLDQQSRPMCPSRDMLCSSDLRGSHIRSLKLNLNGFELYEAVESLLLEMKRMSQLDCLTLLAVPDETNFSALLSLKHQLTSFSCSIWSQYSFTVHQAFFFSQMRILTEMSALEEFDLLVHDRNGIDEDSVKSTQELTRLARIHHGYIQAMQKEGIVWKTLKRFRLKLPTSTVIRQCAAIMPNLTHLTCTMDVSSHPPRPFSSSSASPPTFNLPFSSFTGLTSLSLTFGSECDASSEWLVASLNGCAQLIQLNLTTPQLLLTTEEWTQIFTSSPHLRHLSLCGPDFSGSLGGAILQQKSVLILVRVRQLLQSSIAWERIEVLTLDSIQCDSSQLSLLPHLHSLRELHLRGAVFKCLDYDDLLETFNDRQFIPSLERLEIEQLQVQTGHMYIQKLVWDIRTQQNVHTYRREGGRVRVDQANETPPMSPLF